MVLVLELAPGGELQMVLDRDEIPDERQAAKFLRQILDGVAFLHSLNVAHLDIKPQNLVLTGDFPDCDVKLCDFGISRYISQGADIREILGTPDYTAPEVLNYEPISLATDMWSVGVLLYVLLTGCSPFGGDTKQETFCNISRCKLDFPDDLFEEVSEEAQDLIRRLIVKNSSERLSAMECLQHPWLSKFDDMAYSLSPAISESGEILEAPCDTTSSSCYSSASPMPEEESCTPSPILVDSFDEEETARDDSPEPEFAENEATMQTVSECEESVTGDTTSTIRINDLLEVPTVTTHEVVEIYDKEEDAKEERREKVRKEEEEEEEMSATQSDTGNSTIDDEYSYISSRLNSTFPLTSSSSTSTSSTRHHFSGLSSERRSNFKRSMDFLARKFSASTDLLEVFDDVLGMDTSCRRSSVSATSSSVSEVFKCSPVFILGEEQQCSDSGSDTVSEISTDSSSDRSSIYSDDSLDFILYGKSSQQAGRASFPFSANENQSWKQRTGSTSTGSMRNAPRVWPRECNGVVSKALSRFTSATDHHFSHLSTGKSSIGVSSSSSSTSSITLTTSSTTRTSTTRSISGLEALRNRGENLVVIREPVRAGRYMRYSEVQCESVQARIRRFQVHGSS
ncbi:myosin light chain kinase, smooth muscle-like isoform X2 [Phymastichus coffea]|nr:myosin light chain kinase, smooth muscle-like isoform X2 [Phymastichus coffea]